MRVAHSVWLTETRCHTERNATVRVGVTHFAISLA
jgi:hypothetical protein